MHSWWSVWSYPCLYSNSSTVFQMCLTVHVMIDLLGSLHCTYSQWIRSTVNMFWVQGVFVCIHVSNSVYRQHSVWLLLSIHTRIPVWTLCCITAPVLVSSLPDMTLTRLRGYTKYTCLDPPREHKYIRRRPLNLTSNWKMSGLGAESAYYARLVHICVHTMLFGDFWRSWMYKLDYSARSANSL